jgi:phosphatidylethanolamine-binding protein (PEBP) family uncharacterized protein
MRRRALLLFVLFATAARAPLKLSANFAPGGEFPADNRGDGDGISPPISWAGAPKTTQSYVLIFDSAKAGGGDAEKSKTHWLVYDIPKEVKELREELSGNGASDVPRLGMKEDAGQPPVVVDPMSQAFGADYVDPEIEAMQQMIHGAIDSSFEERNRAKEGSTSFGGTYYRGPSKGGTTATLKLYALSGRIELPRGATREEVIKAMKGKVLDKATLAAQL